MKLLLTSSGIANKSIEKALSELLGKPFNKASLTFVPTAANVEKGDKSWLVNDMNNFKKLGFSSFDIVDISAVPKDIWLPSFESADVMVFGGGDVHYLLSWIKKIGLDILLSDFLKTKVYVGISSGSVVTQKTIYLSVHKVLYYKRVGRQDKTDGLGFVDFELRPHLNSEFFPKVRIPELKGLAMKTKSTFYAIDDDTAIQVVNNKISVISEGNWKKFN